MPDRDFLFEVRVADRHCLDDMLTDLAGRLLGRLGYTSEDVADVVTSMDAELNRDVPGAADPQSVVRFSAHEGELRIMISLAGGREWRRARPLP